MCLDRFLANRHKYESRQKRSADFVALDTDLPGAESPEDTFAREWSRSLFEDAVEELRTNLHERGRGVCCAIFERYDLAETPSSYEALAAEFKISSATVTNYLASARRELRKIVLERLRGVTSGDSEFRREARALLK